MKRLIRIVTVILTLALSCGSVHAKDLKTIMWEEGALFGRFNFCFKDDPSLTSDFGRTFGDAYVRWYQAKNPRANLKVPASMFVNGVHAGVAEQQKMGTEGCGAVYQNFSHMAQVIGVKVSVNPGQTQAPAHSPPLATAPEPSAAPILLWHSNTGWVQGMCSYQLTFDGQGIFFESETGVESLTLSVDVFDAQGNRLASDMIDTEPFADSNATRTTISYWEGDCEAKRIVIWKAEAVIDGSTVDLLKTGQLHIEESPLKEAIELTVKR